MVLFGPEVKASITIEPEGKRNVEGVFAVRGSEVGEFRNITDHLGVTTFLADFVAEFVPDVEPITVLFIDLGATNFDFA